MINKLKIAYLAGIIDGEGSISISDSRKTQKKMHFTTQLAVSSTDEVLLKWIVENFGGCYKTYTPKQLPQNARKNVYKWQVSGDRLVPILNLVLPYLVIKTREAEVMIEMRSTFGKDCKNYVTHKGASNPHPVLKEGILEKRLKCIAELKKLHCRNYNTYPGSHSFKRNRD